MNSNEIFRTWGKLVKKGQKNDWAEVEGLLAYKASPLCRFH